MLPFNQLKYSTKTVIAVTNMKINLDLFYQYVPIVDYSFPKKKRGRKKEGEQADLGPNKLDFFPIGSIIALKNKKTIRGELPKKRQTAANTFFRNSVTIQMKIDTHNKFVNGKVCSNGKFQITGCNEEVYAYKFIYYLYEVMRITSEQIGEDIFTIQKNSVFKSECPAAIINVVMKNINFKIGFNINRERLDQHIRETTDYYSLFLSDLHTCVSIKMEAKKPSEEKLDLVLLKKADDFEKTQIDFSVYSLHYDQNKKNEKKKYHTFLVFYSGSVILSSCGPETEMVYNRFADIVNKNKDLLRENADEVLTIESKDLIFLET
jgi:hypothetical protein